MYVSNETKGQLDLVRLELINLIIKIFLCKEEKLDLTNTWNKHVVLFASRHPPPWPDSRPYLLFSIHVTPSHPISFTLHTPYSVLCPLHIINHSAWVWTSINQTWGYPSKNTLLAMISIILLQQKKMRKHEHKLTLPCRLCPGAPSPAETTFSCLFGEVVRIAWFHLSIFNTKRAGHVGMKS